MEKDRKPAYNMWQNTGWMLRLAWGTYKSIPILCVLIALMSAAQAAAELLLAPAVLALLEQGAPLSALLGTLAALTGALLLLKGLLAYSSLNAIFARCFLRIHTVALKVTEKMMNTSYPNTLNARFLASGDRALAAVEDDESAVQAIWSTWEKLLTNLLGFALYLALLSQCSALLMAVTVATAAAGYFVEKRIEEANYRCNREESAWQHRMACFQRAAANRAYARDVRIFRLQGWLLGAWEKALCACKALIAKREGRRFRGEAADAALALVRDGAAYAVLLQLALTQDWSAARFLLYFTAVSGFTKWVTGILDGFFALHGQSLALCTLREFLDWPEPFLFGSGKPVPAAPDGRYELRLENVSYRYPEARENTITHMNLTIRTGEKVAVVGLNGAGKTTLVKLLCGLLDPDEGRVLLNGEDIRQYDRRDVYRKFAGVFQDFSVLEATLAENVAQRVKGVDAARVRAALRAAGLAQKADALPKGLDTPIGREVYEDGVELSGGEMQRLMLARALCRDAPVLVLDEPTAALDPIAEDDIYRQYDAMTEGRTAVFISHRLASTRFCSRILFLEKGRIAEEGTHRELLAKKGGYAALFEVQSRYYREA